MDFGNAETWGTAIYFWIVPAVLGDAIFPPVPSEMVVITGGALSAEGRANLFLIGLLAASASWAGDVVVFQLFKRRLSHVLDRWRWGRKVHHGIHEAIAKAGRSSTYGTIIGARFIPGGRLATSAAAGIADVSSGGFNLGAGCSPLGHVACRTRLLHGLGHPAALLGQLTHRSGRRSGDRRRRRSHRHPAPRQPVPGRRAGRARPLTAARRVRRAPTGRDCGGAPKANRSPQRVRRRRASWRRTPAPGGSHR